MMVKARTTSLSTDTPHQRSCQVLSKVQWANESVQIAAYFSKYSVL